MTDTTPLGALLVAAAIAWLSLGIWIVLERRSQRGHEGDLSAAEQRALPSELDAKIREVSTDRGWYDPLRARLQGADVAIHEQCARFPYAHHHIVNTIRPLVADLEEETWCVERIIPVGERSPRLSKGLHWTGITLVHRGSSCADHADNAEYGTQSFNRFHTSNRIESGALRG